MCRAAKGGLSKILMFKLGQVLLRSSVPENKA
jgi:hypothetical protein